MSETPKPEIMAAVMERPEVKGLFAAGGIEVNWDANGSDEQRIHLAGALHHHCDQQPFMDWLRSYIGLAYANGYRPKGVRLLFEHNADGKIP